jgi:signal transduction histidine kinase
MALAEQLGIVLETYRLRQTARDVAILEERQRLARDLHDAVSQSIYSLTLFARSGREAAEDGDMAQLIPTLNDIEEISLHALQEMRLMLYELRAPLLEQEGLVRALETRFNLVERRAGLQVNYQVDLPPSKLPQSLELELYRLAIEAFNNIIKHAGARKIMVNLQATNGQVYLKIIDDGCGFDPKQVSGGFGLHGMQERVDRLGGTLDIVSAHGQGTKILVKVNLTDE